MAAKISQNDSQTLRALLDLREMLLRGDFRPGERILEVPLAARLRVSRTPLRMALARLENEGFLESRPTVGYAAREFSVQDTLDAIELRGVLEGTAARLAAERLESKQELSVMFDCVERLQKLLGRKRAGIDLIARYVPLNARLHEHLYQLAKSAMLRRAIDRALALPFASPNCFVTSEAESRDVAQALILSNSQHLAICEAIANREGSRAEAVAREHSRMLRRSVGLALKQRRPDLIPGGSLIRIAEAS
ncbi:MAG TPA: GntR family transcriptional regulator [Bryobacteraceae bacterium]|nr:GntR family transcriptional regulator [Bryobacteraceae bacterium]